MEIPIRGASMGRTFPPGTRVRVELGQEPRFGDMVLIRRARLLVVHRVVGRARQGLWTAGDRSGLDPLISEQAILGRVSAVRHPDGSWVPCRRWADQVRAVWTLARWTLVRLRRSW